MNATTTKFKGVARFGFQDPCYLKDSCDINLNEVCIFKVNASTPFSAESTQIVDCNTQNKPIENQNYKEVCCKFKEICNDGEDNDKDGFIDCADEDCKTYWDDPAPPAFCQGSPFNSETCIEGYTRDSNGNIVITYNDDCEGQPREEQPPIPPEGPNYFFCSYGREENIMSGPGVCCQAGTYAVKNIFSGDWECVTSTTCGLDSTLPCVYDFDLYLTAWLNNPYINNPADWCVSRLPNFFTPSADEMSYPERSTGCCLMVKYADVGFYTDEENVKIFGYLPYCGDDIINNGEQCDGADSITCEEYGMTCDEGYELVGTPKCTNCVATDGSCRCVVSVGGNGSQLPPPNPTE